MELYDGTTVSRSPRVHEERRATATRSVDSKNAGTTEDSLCLLCSRVFTALSTVCRAVGKVSLLIAKHMRPMSVRFPQSARFPKVMRDFYEAAAFPGVTGCVDCAHVDIKSPGREDEEVRT
ncbi:hypothetical protein HPB52_008100 [Rhipicephalus sanguineus]|uniref:Nuclease HARBI1 n=1 Tax=Rhipicephalus sanguineus TaxID=34632 RepID=A0A9D4QKH6_RHISA|nr:hypothetical protein HPB52_008100 [Rhipicephalus sanguineus]